MPKSNSARIVQAQRQRIQISKKSEKYGPSTVYLQVLGSGARGGPNTLYLFTDQKRYLFNCGECTQRLAHEHKVKLSRLDHIFITNKTWRNIGGLPGLSLTLQDVGVPNITLHGPEGLDDLYQATKRFVIMKDMNVTMAECSPSKDFEDNVMTVKYVLLGPLDDLLTDKDLKPTSKKSKLNSDKQFEEFIHDDTDYYIRNTEAKAKPQSKEKPKQKSSVIDPMVKKTEKVLQELQKISNASVAYICTLKKRLGTLDLEKCVERGVKPGPLLGLLKQGQDVVLPDGTLVLSKDVKTPDDPGPVFIVIDLPDISYLKESEFSAHFDNGTNPTENIPTLLVHFTAPDVMQHPRYRQFMSMFGPSTQHLILNQQNSCLGSEAVHRTQHKLHLLDPDIFPMLRDISVPAVWTGSPPPSNAESPNKLKGLEELKNKIALAQFQNIVNLESSGSCKGDGLPGDADSQVKFDLIAGRTLTMFHLRPKIELDRSAEPKLHIQDYIQETMSVDGFVPSLDKFRQLVESVRYEKGRSMKEYPKVVFLGTGSCIPSKTRNTSAIVLHIDESRSLLMDCGEGTFGQLVRFYGPKKVNAFLRTLKGIYISHLHADHHIGLIGVLQARRQACEEVSQEHSPLYLLAPGQIVTWLTLYDEQFERIRSDFTLIPNQNLLHTVVDQRETLTPAIQAHLGVQHIKTCLVAHCPNAFGVAIELYADNKITYSGDTLPCEELVKIGHNSSLLIHEATMEDELSEEARTKMHSTTSQAIEVGRQMGARYTVLTHFSQRYARLPRLNSHILNDNKSIGIAFDNMQVTMSELELLPHMYAPLQLMFVEHCVEMELKAAQRARHKERRASSPTLPPIGPPAKSAKEGEAEPRWQGSGFRVANSSLYGTYVETNSSRLRREMRGKPVNGIVRTPVTCRSESVSPNKNTRSSSRQSSGAATPIAVPHAHFQSPQVIPAPPCVNDKSKVSSRTRDHHQEVASSPQSGTSVKSHRKSMNNNQTKCRSPTCDEVLNTMEMKARLRPSITPTMCTVKHCDPTGYGKPLVTPVNKKLVIKRHQSPAVGSMRKEGGSTPVSPRNNSPGRSGQPSRVASATSKNPVATDLDKETKSPTRSFAKDLKSSYTDKTRQQQGEFYRKIKVMNLEHSSNVPEGLSPVKGSPLLDQVRKSYLPRPTGRCMDNRSKHRLHKTPETSKQSLYKPSSRNDIVRDSSRHSVSQEMCDSKDSIGRDGAVRHTHKSSSLSQNKTFKPQLEDIKSSFLILNAAKKRKAANHNGQSDSALRKHKVISEDERKQQLREIKQKYQSKRFWIDSKYDKIEGLNWISWK